MSLLTAYITWVVIMFMEVYWLYIDLHTGGGYEKILYVVMIITLVVGITGLNLYKKNVK
ncbi:hypothetical protein [Psychrobacillus vulpis]|uniref:hypothetical protein n=1 Tax=Psychrobacillus vulpis TaxID=2325572 RepID=UPI001408EA49|nr:hypothetical protein [Psychrobacillus vulpis]